MTKWMRLHRSLLDGTEGYQATGLMGIAIGTWSTYDHTWWGAICIPVGTFMVWVGGYRHGHVWAARLKDSA